MKIFNFIKSNERLKVILFLSFISLFCLSLSIFRIYKTGSSMYFFLNWNLFLAYIPLIFSSFIIYFKKLENRKILIFLILLVWLLFFPNAPYILTDLFHLKRESKVPVWFDLILIMSFAWTGLIMGFLSLFDIENLLFKTTKTSIKIIIISIILFVSSFGIYLGRFLRWNSWDIVSRPQNLFFDIFNRIANPFNYPKTWSVTILLGILLNIMYWTLRLIINNKTYNKLHNN